MQGQVTDMEIYYNLNQGAAKALYDILPITQVKNMIRSRKIVSVNNWMTAEESEEYD